MKRIFQFKKTTNPTDIVAEKTNNLFNNHQKQQLNNNNNNTFSDFPYIFTQNLSSTCKRRFSENYYKSFEVHKRPRLVKKCGEYFFTQFSYQLVLIRYHLVYDCFFSW